MPHISITKAMAGDLYHVWHIDATSAQVWIERDLPIDDAIGVAIDLQARLTDHAICIDGLLYQDAPSLTSHIEGNYA
jgi:hypothetical protein